MRSIDQERAANALARVDELRRQSEGFGKPEDFRNRYRGYIDRIGSAIVMNGLGQALATERAGAGAEPKKDDERAHHEVYRSLQLWLCRDEGGVYPSSEDLLEAIMAYDEAHYLRAQAEALSWLEWHKKCCRARFPSDDGAGE